MKKYQVIGKREGIEVYSSKLYPTWLGAKRVLVRLRREHPSNDYKLFER